MNARALKILAETKLLPLLLLLVLPAVAQAQFTFTTNDDQITITGYSGPPWDVTIPDETNGYPVTSIGEGAFYGTLVTSVTIGTNVTTIGDSAFGICHSLTSITIPASVTSIGDSAFAGCYNMTSVTIGTNVTSIGTYAFDGAILTSVSIPASVTNIEDHGFYGCPSLTAITVDTHNLVYSGVAGILFDKRQTTLIQYPAAKSGTSYTIPASVTSIGDGAFFYCILMTSVTIPDSVTSIGSQAFWNCTSLTSVTIGNGVTSIGSEAFGYCTGQPRVNFRGNSPTTNNDLTVFTGDSTGTVYYLPGTMGWTSTFDGWPTKQWFLPNPLILGSSSGLGAQTNGFGFTISWATNTSVVVEATTNLANPVWIPVSTNTLIGGTSNFSDLQWTNYPGRYYRLSSQ